MWNLVHEPNGGGDVMDIYITGINASGVNQKITLPVVPESISYSAEARFAEYEVINKGQVQMPDGKNLFDLSWEGFFPGEALRGSRLVLSLIHI